MRKVVREFSDSVQNQIPGIALFQGRDVAGEISAEQLCVPCQRLREGARRDVLGIGLIRSAQSSSDSGQKPASFS